MKTLAVLLLLFSGFAQAASLTYTDSKCASFTIAPSGAITCNQDISAPSAPVPTAPQPAQPVPHPSADLCAQYGITSNITLPREGNLSKEFAIGPTQAYSFSFQTGTVGKGGQMSTNYANSAQYITLSKNKCDFGLIPRYSKCSAQGTPPLIYYKVGAGSIWQCSLEPNTTYYFNVRNASIAPDGVISNTCTGKCSFRVF